MNRCEARGWKTRWKSYPWNPAIWPSSKVTNTAKPEPSVDDHCSLTHSLILVFLLSEDYTEELAVAHIRRLLDIVACNTSFASAKPPAGKSKDPTEPGSENGSETNPKSKPVDPNSDPANAKSDKADADISMCPPPRLGQFYDFFSFSHLTPPFQCELFIYLFLNIYSTVFFFSLLLFHLIPTQCN